MPIRTPRLDLIASTIEHLDAELTHALAPMLDATVPASWPPGHYDADAIQFFRGRLVAEGVDAVGWYGWYAIMRESRTLVASGGYMGRPSDGTVEIGYSVIAEYRNQGIASEIIVALTERALAMTDVARVVAHVAPDNIASRRALERAGFREAGEAENAMLRYECRQVKEAARVALP